MGLLIPELNHTHLSEVYNAGRAATAALLAFFLDLTTTLGESFPRRWTLIENAEVEHAGVSRSSFSHNDVH